MYIPKEVVGRFGEDKVTKIFDLLKADQSSLGKVPDLASRDGSFFVEVKTSAYNNGGVIKGSQLYNFDRYITGRRFYAFVYHSITKPMYKNYPNESDLERALQIRSLYLFPFSIVMAHYEHSKLRSHPADNFAQMKENMAKLIFSKDYSEWERIGANPDDYKMTNLHERVHLATFAGCLEKKVIESFHSRFI